MTLLNIMDAIFLGDRAVDAVFYRGVKIWPPAGFPSRDVMLMGLGPIMVATGSVSRDFYIEGVMVNV